MNDLPGEIFQAHAILKGYVSIHDQIFKRSLRKVLPIPGFFKPIDYDKHFKDLGVLVDALTEVVSSADLGALPSVFPDYVSALLRTIIALRDLCEKLLAKSAGGDKSYTMDEYNTEVAAYQDLAAEYQRLGFELNRQTAMDYNISPGLIRPAKSWMLSSHIIHIIAGLLTPYIFIWSTGGVLAVVLLSAISQGIDQFRIHRAYRMQFQAHEQIPPYESRLAAYDKDTLYKHGQIFIFKVVWYGLLTMVAAGFRRFLA